MTVTGISLLSRGTLVAAAPRRNGGLVASDARRVRTPSAGRSSAADNGRSTHGDGAFSGVDQEVSVAKEDRGFASMDRAKQREIASKGGKAAHAKGTAHEWTSEEAREAGRKGGMASHRRRKEMNEGGQGDEQGSPTEEPAFADSDSNEQIR